MHIKSRQDDLTSRQQWNDSFKWWKRHFDKINKYRALFWNYTQKTIYLENVETIAISGENDTLRKEINIKRD